MRIVQHLNWNLQTYKEREEMVEGLLKDGILETLSPYQLNEVTNYLLYAKDVDVEVKLRVSSKQIISYEELVDNGVAETILRKPNASIYKVVKPTIDREKDKDIPGMVELWEAIEVIKKKYDYVRGVLKGEIERDFTNPMEPTFVLHNFYRSWYIDLCRNQYYLKDIFNPPCFIGGTIFTTPARDRDLLGIKVGKKVVCEGDKMIDFGNPEHIYQLLRFYAHIKEKHFDRANDGWLYLYEYLDEIISEMNWSDTHWLILQGKVDGKSNEELYKELTEQLGVNISVNYISTVYRRHISRDIARRAGRKVYEWEHRHDKSKWKTCRKCKEKKFFSTEHFGNNKFLCAECSGKKPGLHRKLVVKGLD